MDGLPLAFNRVLLLGAILLWNVGCVGLNIPSGRYHDSSPAATGEMVPGGPRRLDHALFFAKPAAGGNAMLQEAHCVDGTRDDGMPGDMREREKSLPSVPWPRFHPVPTSPAFAGPDATPASKILAR